jgi:hypothetical protein
MADVVYLLIFVAFFMLATGYVKACEAIIGPDQAASADVPETEPEPLAA